MIDGIALTGPGGLRVATIALLLLDGRLTALAVVAGATVILADPIFQGLAIALMAGSLISMFTAPVLVPLLYFMAHNRNPSRQS